MDILIKVSFIILGVFLSGVGYLIKRKIENKSNTEILERKKHVLEIHKQMKEQGLEPADLMKLESLLVGRNKSINENKKQIEEETTPLVQEEIREDLTQSELNERANKKFGEAKEKLQKIIDQLSSKLGKTEREALLKSQRSWEEYSHEQALAASSSYRQGSIYPLIYFSEIESLTIERAARLKAELDELINLGN